MIQIIRLKNGEDIIGQVASLESDTFEIKEPMSVGLEYHNNQSHLVMHHWLPVQIISINKTVLKKEDVLTTFLPNEEFAEYYTNTIDKLNKILEAKRIAESMTDEEIQQAMEVIHLNEGRLVIH
jgi:hypothetical protein